MFFARRLCRGRDRFADTTSSLSEVKKLATRMDVFLKQTVVEFFVESLARRCSVPLGMMKDDERYKILKKIGLFLCCIFLLVGSGVRAVSHVGICSESGAFRIDPWPAVLRLPIFLRIYCVLSCSLTDSVGLCSACLLWSIGR